jgi:hypothetical protein
MRHDRSAPLPAAWTVRAGRDAYLAENGFSVAAYDEPRTKASLLGWNFTVPNTAKHRWAIQLHDLHHVATGYGTDIRGEAEISAWELRRGIAPTGLYVQAIITSGVAAGLLIAPGRTLRALRAAPGSRSLFHEGRTYDELLAMTIGELRAWLSIPPQGLAERPRALHSSAPR